MTFRETLAGWLFRLWHWRERRAAMRRLREWR